jgi:hypothetical protein
MSICFMASVIALPMGCERQGPVTEHTEANGEVDMEEKALLQIAQKYLSQHRPEWNEVSDLQPRIIEHDDYWKVTWDLPPNMMGGTPVLHIDKSTREVIEAYHEQ